MGEVCEQGGKGGKGGGVRRRFFLLYTCIAVCLESMACSNLCVTIKIADIHDGRIHVKRAH